MIAQVEHHVGYHQSQWSRKTVPDLHQDPWAVNLLGETSVWDNYKSRKKLTKKTILSSRVVAPPRPRAYLHFQHSSLTLLLVRIDTGRRHQIRSHLAFLQHPTVCCLAAELFFFGRVNFTLAAGLIFFSIFSAGGKHTLPLQDTCSVKMNHPDVYQRTTQVTADIRPPRPLPVTFDFAATWRFCMGDLMRVGLMHTLLHTPKLQIYIGCMLQLTASTCCQLNKNPKSCFTCGLQVGTSSTDFS